MGKLLWAGDKGATDGRGLGGSAALSEVTVATGSMTSCGGSDAVSLSLQEAQLSGTWRFEGGH